MSVCAENLPPRTTSVPAVQVRHEGDALIVGRPGAWHLADSRDIAAEIIDEYSPELSAAYRASVASGELWQYQDVALLAATVGYLRAGVTR